MQGETWKLQGYVSRRASCICAESMSKSFLQFCFASFPLLQCRGFFCWQAVIEKTKLDPSEVGDIVVGTVLGSGSQKATEFRMAAFYAGFPGEISLVSLDDLLCIIFALCLCSLCFCWKETVPVRTVNRQCSSGLQAVADVAAAIKAGFYDIGKRVNVLWLA